jgi:hypothetical protein
VIANLFLTVKVKYNTQIIRGINTIFLCLILLLHSNLRKAKTSQIIAAAKIQQAKEGM